MVRQWNAAIWSPPGIAILVAKAWTLSGLRRRGQEDVTDPPSSQDIDIKLISPTLTL